MSDSSIRARRHFSADEKMALLKRHLVDHVPVSDLCDEQGIQPTLFYQWQKQLFERGGAAFERKAAGQGRGETMKDRKIARLEEKLSTKNEVIAELMEANVREKKANGEL